MPNFNPLPFKLTNYGIPIFVKKSIKTCNSTSKMTPLRVLKPT